MNFLETKLVKAGKPAFVGRQALSILAASLFMGASRCLSGAESAGSPTANLPPASKAPPASESISVNYNGNIAPLLNKYCTECHGGKKPKGDIVLSFKDEGQVRAKAADTEFWGKVAEMLSSREMPPKRAAKKPSDAERERLVSWIQVDLLGPSAARRGSGQVAKVRRVTREEYANTVRDLFSFSDFKAEDLPPDELGYGFDNIADLMTISPNQLELYLKTAEQAIAQLDKTAKPSSNWAEKDKTYSEPDDGVFIPIKDVKLRFNNNQARVRIVLEKFLPRAYRRPVKKEEIDRLIAFAQLSLTQEGESFIRPKSVYAPLRAALSSPYFLYRVEQDPPEGTAPINEFELASRLSYFLWSSMPDDELFELAGKNQLRAHQEEQVRRMLKDPKARALTRNFAGQWLHLAALKNALPDPKLYPEFDESLRQALLEETRRFVAHVIEQDRSIMDFLDADYSFLNERVAKHYGIDGVRGDEFRLVKLDSARRRGGLLTQGSILTLTSPPTRTSPVKRGVWVLETLFNEHPAPPPANVPPLEAQAVVGTVRKVLEAHRANAQCAGCHAKIDPYGLALENFNAIGAWRVQDHGSKIDASGKFPNGRSYRDLAEFRTRLSEKKDDFRKALVAKLLVYALGRGLEYGDRSAVQSICSSVSAQHDRFSGVILAIIGNDLFQKRTAMAVARN